MSDEILRALEREARGKKDQKINEALKRAQQRAGLPTVGITIVREEPDAYVIDDLLHEGTFHTIAWSKTRIPASGFETPDRLVALTKGGLIERTIGLFSKRKTWELPDTKLIYSTITALNQMPWQEETPAHQLREHLSTHLIGWSNFVTSTRISYGNGEQDTLIHRYGTRAATRTQIPLKGQPIYLEQKNERAPTLLYTLFGTTDARQIQLELAKFAGARLMPGLLLTPAPEYIPTTEPIIITFNRRPSHGDVAYSMRAAPISQTPRDGQSIPIQYR